MIKMTRVLLIIAGLLSTTANAGSPNCSGPDNYAATAAYAYLKNLGIVKNETTAFSKTKVVRLASEKIGKDLYRQVHLITFLDKSDHKTTAITVNDASHDECSMTGPTVFVVSKQSDNYP